MTSIMIPFIAKKIYSNNAPSVFRYNNPVLFIDMSNYDKNIKTEKKKAVSDWEIESGREKEILDSLLKNDKISNASYLFFNERLKNTSIMLAMQESKISFDSVIRNITNKEKDISGLIPSPSHFSLVENMADKFITSKCDFVDIKDGVNRDYRQSYIAIYKSEKIPILEKIGY